MGANDMGMLKSEESHNPCSDKGLAGYDLGPEFTQPANIMRMRRLAYSGWGGGISLRISNFVHFDIHNGEQAEATNTTFGERNDFDGPIRRHLKSVPLR
jgi:hypothetical protein